MKHPDEQITLTGGVLPVGEGGAQALAPWRQAWRRSSATVEKQPVSLEQMKQKLKTF